MPLLTCIIGGSMFGFAARLGQLSIQHRNIFENLGGHAISTLFFGYMGYWAYRWDVRANELLDIKEAEMKDYRRRQAERIKRLEEKKNVEEKH